MLVIVLTIFGFSSENKDFFGADQKRRFIASKDRNDMIEAQQTSKAFVQNRTAYKHVTIHDGLLFGRNDSMLPTNHWTHFHGDKYFNIFTVERITYRNLAP